MSNQFNYNLNSINFFIQENSGSITGVSTEFEDYGDAEGLPVQLGGQVWLPQREESIHDFSYTDTKFFNTFDSELTRFDTNLELEDWGCRPQYHRNIISFRYIILRKPCWSCGVFQRFHLWTCNSVQSNWKSWNQLYTQIFLVVVH